MSLFARLVVATVPLVPKVLVGRVARRYVAGETREQAIAVARSMNELGARATLDVLGEEVHEPEKATEAVEEYIGLLNDFEAAGVDANVSLKPTQLGLKIDKGLCRENIGRVAAVAREHGNFVRIEMEDRSCTDETLEIYSDLQAQYGNVGIVLQA